MDIITLNFIADLAPLIGVAIVAITAGWVVTTWMRIKNGYPLEGAWGNALHPKIDQQTAERIKLLNQENAQLRAEISGFKDRLAVVEKIVVDDGHRLTHEIESLIVKRSDAKMSEGR